MSSEDEENGGNEEKNSLEVAPKKKNGRPFGIKHPNKLDDTFIDRYCTLTKAGLSPNKACEQLGVSMKSLQRWKRDGLQHLENGANTVYARLAKAAPEAENKLVSKALERIVDDVEDYDSRTSVDTAWKILERREPETWGPPKQRTEHVSTQHVFKHEGLSLGEMMRMLRVDIDQPTEQEEEDVIDAEEWSSDEGLDEDN